MTKVGIPFGTLSSDIDSGYGVAFGGDEEEEDSGRLIDDFGSFPISQSYSRLKISQEVGNFILDLRRGANVPTLSGVPNPSPGTFLIMRPNNLHSVYIVSFPGNGLPYYPKSGDVFSVWIGEDSSKSVTPDGITEFSFSFLFGVSSASNDVVQDAYAATYTGGTVDDRVLELRKARGREAGDDWDDLGSSEVASRPKETVDNPGGWTQLVVFWGSSVKKIVARDFDQNVIGSLTVQESDPVLDSSRGVGFLARKITSTDTPFIGERKAIFEYAVAEQKS